MTVGIEGEVKRWPTAAEKVALLLGSIVAAIVFIGSVVFVSQIVGVTLRVVIPNEIIPYGVLGALLLSHVVLWMWLSEAFERLLIRYNLAYVDENDRIVFDREWDSSIVGE